MLFSTSKAFAANVFLDADAHSFSSGQEFVVNVFLDTQSDSVNAIQGSIIISTNLLDVKEVRDGNSTINFWIERPNFQKDPSSTNEGSINFSGITPGGFLSPKAPLFSVVFTSKSAGVANLAVSNLKILKNDGKGTEVVSKSSPFSFTISNDTGIASKIAAVKDAAPPESFGVTTSQDPNIFDGKHFLVFATQDKDSGVDHYEVKEGIFGTFIVGASPYLLQNQSLNTKISVKAIDRAGNSRVVTLYPQGAVHLYELYTILGIILLVFAFGLLRKQWEKFVS
jgi:hypothetical protein